jgi:hypothetical protein
MDWPDGDEQNLHHPPAPDANGIVLARQDWSGDCPARLYPDRRRTTGLNIAAAISYDRMLAAGGMFSGITPHP